MGIFRVVGVDDGATLRLMAVGIDAVGAVRFMLVEFCPSV